MKQKKWSLIILVLILIGGLIFMLLNQNPAPPLEPKSFNHVSVHDPSIIKEGDLFYMFGTHIEAAKSSDLMNWERFTNGYTTPNNVLFQDLSENLAESFLWAGEDDADSKDGYAVWAPEIFWNPNYINEDGSQGAYMLYYSASSTYVRSAIGFAVAPQIEGPYTYVDTIVYSGFTKEEAYDENSQVDKKWVHTHLPTLIEEGQISDINPDWFLGEERYHNAMYPNAIDANLFYDADGRLWMSYGSWSGGIFLLELDDQTGLPLYPGVDGITEDGRLIDRYFGIKISGGEGQSGEGPYIIYDAQTQYYYLYVTYGWLGADGGYNMRVFRAKEPTGPYLDIKDDDAVLKMGEDNFTKGNKLMGNFLFTGEPGSTLASGYVSPGHNSVFHDEDTNKRYLVFHTRFPNAGEMYQARVHQLFMNEANWPVVAVHPYAGEQLRQVRKREIVGDYKFINHGMSNSAAIVESIEIKLNTNQTLTGAVEGTWQKVDDYFAEIIINDIVYRGVFVEAWSPEKNDFVMTFTAVSDKGVSIWGSQ